jgi:3D (Asp-Asp-Asp) domain-containing protein
MYQMKRVGRGKPTGQNAPLISQSAYENRQGFRTVCLVTALVLLFAVVISTVPPTAVQLVRLSLGDYRAAASAPSDALYPQTGFSAVAANDLDEVSELLAELAEADALKVRIKNGDFVFAPYITTLSREEAQVRLDEIKAAKEKAEAAERAKASVTVYTNYTSYVSLNTKGVPMSQKGTVEVDANGVPLHYTRLIQGHATAYYGGTLTATGTRPMQGTVAVDPREIPYGTRMYITSADGSIVYGLAVAEDTGGFIYWPNGATVDLYMWTYSDCVQWGWRMANIYILD